MGYDAFVEKIMEAVREKVTEETDVSLTTVQKNNGVVLKGVMIKKKISIRHRLFIWKLIISYTRKEKTLKRSYRNL